MLDDHRLSYRVDQKILNYMQTIGGNLASTNTKLVSGKMAYNLLILNSSKIVTDTQITRDNFSGPTKVLRSFH